MMKMKGNSNNRRTSIDQYERKKSESKGKIHHIYVYVIGKEKFLNA